MKIELKCTLQHVFIIETQEVERYNKMCRHFSNSFFIRLEEQMELTEQQKTSSGTCQSSAPMVFQLGFQRSRAHTGAKRALSFEKGIWNIICIK